MQTFTNKQNKPLHSLSFNISWFSRASFLTCDYLRLAALLLTLCALGCIYIAWFDIFLGDLLPLSVHLATAWAKQENLFFNWYFFFPVTLAPAFLSFRILIWLLFWKTHSLLSIIIRGKLYKSVDKCVQIDTVDWRDILPVAGKVLQGKLEHAIVLNLHNTLWMFTLHILFFFF